MNILFILLLIIVSVIDIKKREIPDIICISIAITSLFNFHLGGLFVAIPFFVSAMADPEYVGGGDIKLTAVSGLFLGFETALFGVIVALTSAIIFYIVSGRKEKFLPLAPFLTIGFLTAMIGGI